MEKAIKRYMPIFVLPTLAAFTVGFIAPFLVGIWLSFCKFTTITDAKFVGFINYAKVFGDATFVHSLWYTTLFTIVTVILINFLAFAVAMALTAKIKGNYLFRTIFFMPNLIGGIVLGYIWSLLLNGILAIWMRTLTYSATYGFWGLVILMLWQQVGYMMIIYIAGLQSIPSDYIEAAKVDGATAWQTFWKVKIPNLMPTITICLFLSITNGFKLFDQNLALTGGAPAHSTEMLALNIYNTFYSRAGIAWQGIGQAKAVIFCILVVAISMIQLKATRSKEVQQ